MIYSRDEGTGKEVALEHSGHPEGPSLFWEQHDETAKEGETAEREVLSLSSVVAFTDTLDDGQREDPLDWRVNVLDEDENKRRLMKYGEQCFGYGNGNRIKRE